MVPMYLSQTLQQTQLQQTQLQQTQLQQTQAQAQAQAQTPIHHPST